MVRRLTVMGVKNAKPGRHADGGGLYLEVMASGARRWFLRTMVQGRRRDVGLGSAELITLAEAREMAHRLRKVARSGGDPFAERDGSRKDPITLADAVKRVWAEQIAPNNRNAKHVAQWLGTLERFAFPEIGDRPIASIEQADVLRVLAPIWTEIPETARRVKQRLHAVLDWAATAGHREGVNPVDGVTRGLPRQRDRVRHFKAVPWQEMPALWGRLCGAPGMGVLALRFTILTAARSGEVRGATWGEVDIVGRVWTIPAERMKAGREHRVPLSAPAIDLLHPLDDTLLFPSNKAGRPLSDMTLSAVLRRLGVDATVHGFRSSFRDWAEEATMFSREVKEAALAHTVENRAERAYRRGDLFEQRQAMMDAWAAFLIS